MITKGIRISQLVERKDLNGKEIIPFQDGIHNGKLSIQSLVDYIGDISDSDLVQQALIKIQKFVDTVSEMDLLLYQAKEGDIYYCKENKKLYVRSFNKWDMLDPLTSKVYVLVGLDEYNRTNIIYLWDGNDMVVMSERLFLGEVTGTAYPGDKGKATTDKLNRMPDKLITDTVNVNQSTTEAVLNFATYRQEAQQVGRNALTITSATTSQAGLMSSSDKTKLDGLKDQSGIISDINAVQTNLKTHINNKSNPHKVTKDQVGLGNVDNTSDANKPISNATQTALNGKFSATDGNALKQRVNNIPKLVATDITVDSDNDSVNISLDKTSIVDGTLSGTTININSATASKAGILVPTDKSKIDKIITNGNGTKYLSDNGTYKEVQGGSADIESLKQYVNDSISSARRVGYMMQLTEIDASGLDENTWYPVTIAAGERMNIRVEVLVALDSGTKPSWSTHNRGFGVRKIWEFAPYAWGVNSRSIFAVHLSDFNFAKTDPVRGLSTLSNYDLCYVYVRGGGKYHFYASHGARVILHTDTYAPGSGNQSISPTTEIPDLIREIDYSNYGKVIDVPNGAYLTLDKNATGTEAIEFINNIFGSTDRLKEVVMDVIDHHQKYSFHSYASKVNCLGISNVYAYYEHTTEEYNFQYNVSYYTANGPVSKRMTFKLMPNNEDCVAISEDLLPDWHSIKNVLNGGNEFNFVDGEVGERVWLNYRSRSGKAVSAGKLYIGNGQATGGFAEVHASGFFKESDIRLKSDIAPLKHTLDQICNIPTVEFNMHDKHQIGTIAQDLENNFAEIVNTDSDGMKSVDYCMLGVVAVEGIKLLKQEIEDLKKQVEELKNGNAILGRNL